MFSFPFLKIKAQQENVYGLQSICESTSFSILEHANLRKAVTCSFHKACSLLQENVSHKEERENACIFLLFEYSSGLWPESWPCHPWLDTWQEKMYRSQLEIAWCTVFGLRKVTHYLCWKLRDKIQFDFHWAVHRNIISIAKQTICTNV